MNITESFILYFPYNNAECCVTVKPLQKGKNKIPESLHIITNNLIEGDIYFTKGKWISYNISDYDLIETIGHYIEMVYEKENEIVSSIESLKFSMN